MKQKNKLLMCCGILIFTLSSYAFCENWLPKDEQDLKENFVWVRPKENGYKFENGSLHLRSHPGNIFNTVARMKTNGQNLLLKKLNKTNIEVTLKLTFHPRPSVQGDQAGVFFYYDDDNYVKIVKEYSQNKDVLRCYMVRENKSLQTEKIGLGVISYPEMKEDPKTCYLRLVLKGDAVEGFHKVEGDKEWTKSGKTVLPKKGINVREDAPLYIGIKATGCPAEITNRFAEFHNLTVRELTAAEIR